MKLKLFGKKGKVMKSRKKMKDALNEMALRHRFEDAKTGKITKESIIRSALQESYKKLRAATRGEVYTVNEKNEIFNVVNKSGFEYKGQHSMCLCKLTKGMEVDVDVNVGDLFVPGVIDLSVGGSVKYMQGKNLMINVEAQRVDPKDKEVYICMSFMQGKVRDWSVEFGAEVGASLPKDLKDKLGREKDLFYSETMGFSVEAEAKAGAKAGYQGTYLHVCFPFSPLYYRREKGFDDLKKDLFSYLTSNKWDASLYKESLKKEVCGFINLFRKDKIYYQQSRLRGLWGKGHVSTNTLIRELEAIKKEHQGDKDLEELVAFYIERLNTLKKAKKVFNKYASLRLWGHEGSAEAGIKASFGVSGNISKISGSAGVSIEGPSINGELKRTSYRYQMMQADHKTIKTQDTVITYKSLQGKWFGVSASIGVSAALEHTLYEEGDEENKTEITAEGPSYEKGIEKEYSKEWCVINQMTYRSGVLFWNFKNIEGSIKVLPGSGLSYGQSIIPQNFLKAAYTIFDKKIDKKSKEYKAGYNYIISLMAALNLDFKKQEEFKAFIDFMKGAVSILEGFPYSAAIVEANFATVTSEVEVKEKKKKNIKSLVEPEDLLKCLARGPLQAIRLRYRIREEVGGESDLFTLGIHIGKTGTSIKLKKAEEAGSEGMVDIHIHWVFVKDNSVVGSYDNYNRVDTVPPVILFYQ